MLHSSNLTTFLILLLSLRVLSVYAQEVSDSISSNQHPESPEGISSNGASSIQHQYDKDLLTKEFHEGRRDILRALLPSNSVAVFFANPVRNRSNDINYEYHQNPDFYYLTGLNEPHSLLLLFKEEQNLDSIVSNEYIIIKPRDTALVLWGGKKLSMVDVSRHTGIDISAIFLNDEFADLEIDFPSFNKVFYIPTYNDVRDDKTDRGDLYSLIKHFKLKLQTSIQPAFSKHPSSEWETNPPQSEKNTDTRMLKEMMFSLREVKQDEELILIRKAINITCEAHSALMKMLEPGMKEYQAEAIIEYIFKTNGAEHTGFPSIVGGGENTCILHYTSNRKELFENELLIIDIGAEYHGYTGDITRTLPVNGKFTQEQKIIYNIVLEAQTAAIRTCKVGNRFWTPNETAIRVVKKKLLREGIIKNENEYHKYLMHGTSHYVGLDVHDAGLYSNLKPGNVITIEPGIYIPEGSDCNPKWWNIGIRIEDDILITNTGPEILSDCVPKSIEEIEKLMQIEGNKVIGK